MVFELTSRRGTYIDIAEKLAEAGVLSKETHETVVRLAPPLCIDRTMIDLAVTGIDGEAFG